MLEIKKSNINSPLRWSGHNQHILDESFGIFNMYIKTAVVAVADIVGEFLQDARVKHYNVVIET